MKLLGVSYDSLSKIMGISKASLSKIGGASKPSALTYPSATFKPTATVDDFQWWTEYGGGLQNSNNWAAFGTHDSHYHAGYNFSDITIPQNASIISATITFNAYTTRATANPHIHISAYDADTGGTSPTTSAGANALTLTTAEVGWDPGAWVINTDYTTPDLKTIVQEIVDRAGFAYGNKLLMMFKDASPTIVSYSMCDPKDYTNSTTLCARLYVQWLSYASWNSNDSGANITLSNNNLSIGRSTDATFSGIRSTLGKSSGKWYWEYTYTTSAGSNWPVVGVANSSQALNDNVGNSTNSWGYYASTGGKIYNDIETAYGNSFAQGDKIGIALDMDTGKVWFSKNGTWQNSGNPAAGTGEAFSGLTGTIYPCISIFQQSSIWTANFGKTTFSYTVPTGFNSGLYDGAASLWNPNDKNADIALSVGNTKATSAAGDAWRTVRADTGKMTSGKYYFEAYVNTHTAGGVMVGITDSTMGLTQYLGQTTYSYSFWSVNAKYYHNGAEKASGLNYTAGDTVMVAFDIGAGKLWFGKNGTWNSSGDPVAGTNPIYTDVDTSRNYYPAVSLYNTEAVTLNTGIKPFTYRQPSGFRGIFK